MDPMPKQRRLWTRTIDEAGVSVRLYEREPRGVWIGAKRDRKSFGHADRKLAEQQGRALAKRIAELQYAGHGGAVTLGQLTALYFQHRGPLLSDDRRKAIKSMIALLEEQIGR